MNANLNLDHARIQTFLHVNKIKIEVLIWTFNERVHLLLIH